MADRDLSATPAIEQALSTETNNQARVNIASALASAGDPIGAKYLETMCSDASLPDTVILRVVHSLAVANFSHPQLASPGKCADAVLSALESGSESYQRAALVTAFPSMYKDVPKDKAERMVADAQNLLGDNDSSVRMVTSQALADMGSTDSIELIRNAMERETDPALRAVHQRNLDKLLKLQRQSAPAAPANPQH